MDSGKDSASEEQLLRADEEENINIVQKVIEETSLDETKTVIIDKEKSKKTHWKSQSLGEVINNGQGNSVSDKNDESELTNSFSKNRELWQRRAASQTQLQPGGCINKDIWELRQKHTPDLVMDLPLVGSSEVPVGTKSGGDSPTGPESPDMTTAAERFAKQNQCTLKKNTKGTAVHTRQTSSSSQEGKEEDSKPSETPPPVQPKPQIKAKPQLMRKPVLNAPHHPSPQLMRKDSLQPN